VATPANWNHGDKCMVVPSLSDEDAKKKLGSFVTTEVPSGKKYIRMTVSYALSYFTHVLHP
jgi:1-Cys peroxiredoxin 6